MPLVRPLAQPARAEPEPGAEPELFFRRFRRGKAPPHIRGQSPTRGGFIRGRARTGGRARPEQPLAAAETADDGGEFEAIDGFCEVHLVAFGECADAIFGSRVCR